MKTHYLRTVALACLTWFSVLDANAGITYRIYATREGLVGGTTANGHIIQPRDHFCALPSTTVLNPKGGRNYTVTIRNPQNGRVASNVPVWDVGPWNIKDNYWHVPREMWKDLPRGKPEAEAAYYNNYNGGRDGFGRQVANGAGIDLADGTFWDDLGMINNGWVDVTFNWENDAPRRPTSLKATVVSWQRIDLKWQDNSNDENHFEIQRMNVDSGGSWNDIHHNSPNDREYHVTGLSSNTKYKFRVRACNGQGNSDWSNVETATTFNRNAPDKPSNLTATANNDDKITLAWSDNSNNEDGFTIHQSNDGSTWTKIKDTGANVSSYAATGLRGNRKYYFRVRAFNSNEPTPHSDWSNTASDTTPPPAPTALTAVKGATWDSAKLSWTDNAGAEVGFKIERGTASAGPFTQIATNAASDTTYSDLGLTASIQYWYRVRAYNANGNSQYSNIDSVTTGNAPPVLSTIGNKTVTAGQMLSFTAIATDPGQIITTDMVSGFQSFTPPTTDGTVMFRAPKHSATTSAFIDTSSTNYTKVVDTQPAGNGSTKSLKGQWTLKTGQSNPWIRLTTVNAQNLPNPVIDLSHTLRLQIYSTKAIKVALGVRETTNNPAVGGDGGTTGPIEWVGVTNITGSAPVPTRAVAANTWTTLSFNNQKNPAWSFSGGNSIVSTGRGVLEHLAIVPDGTSGSFTVYIDDVEVVYNNTLEYTLDAGAPSGASVRKKGGQFTWTPATAQVGNHRFTVRVTDQLGAEDFETITVTVTGTGNSPPVLSAIGNKTAKEGTALSFTAAASDPDAGQTKTFSLDAGAPSGAAINSSSGAFSWTPSESQGGGTYPITVRVTDNGSPSSNDFETITVTVDEVNSAPIITAIADQTINEGATFNFTVSATDADVPAQTKTYELLLAPPGMTINTNTGALAWTTVEVNGPDTNLVTVRVTDNGVPKLWAERTFNIIVNELNAAPVLTVSADASTTISLTDFENYGDGSYNGTIMFRQPSYSGSTSTFIDTALANETTITTNAPQFAENSILQASFAFKTGQTNPWMRMTTDAPPLSEYSLPNPTIDLGKHLKFSIYSDKSIKICLGVRETGMQVPIGDNGGQTGAIEWVGATGTTGGAPICTRTIPANTWTTVDFDLANEPIAALTGNGSLAPGKGTLEHLAIVPNGGSGVHTFYVDNFTVYTSSTNMTVNTGEEITLNCSATDADRPSQTLTFSLDAGAPTNATINDELGTFTWTPTPEQSPSTNVITIRVTDNGPGALSAAKNVTIRVNKVNTPPVLTSSPDFVIELGANQIINYTNTATDADIPANSLTFSLVGTIPAGATINPTTGAFNWTPPSNVLTNYFITIRATDNGVPPLYTEKQFAVRIVPVNAAPTLSLGTGRITETVAHFETFANNTADGTVMFRKPTLATQTSGFLDTVAANSYTKATNSFPSGNPTGSGTRALVAKWTFKTGIANYWVRLTTTNAASLPNPTIDLGARVKFDIHSSKAVKVGLGIRETGTSAEIGANGGTTGGIEWIGVTNVTSGNPTPNRLVPANTWTTLEFNLPSEPCMNFSGGNGVLATGKGVLECLAIRGEGGTGAYTVYVDNFSVVNTVALPTTVTMKTGSTLTFTASATDPNPGLGVTFGINPDFEETHTNANMNLETGAFSWTPEAVDAGTSSLMTVFAEDNPTNGSLAKIDSKSFTINVTSDSIAAQSPDGGSFIAGGDSAELNWDSVPGSTYKIQSKANNASTWSDVLTVTATQSTSSTKIRNATQDAYYRVVEVEASSAAAE